MRWRGVLLEVIGLTGGRHGSSAAGLSCGGNVVSNRGRCCGRASVMARGLCGGNRREYLVAAVGSRSGRKRG